MVRILLLLIYFFTISCNNSKQNVSEEDSAWEEVKIHNSLSTLDSFLIQFPETKRKTEIAARREGIFYRTAVFENSEFYYNLYQKEFPQGKRIKEIESKKELLKKEEDFCELVDGKTFVGSLQADFNKPQREILTIIFKKIDPEKKFEATVFLTSDIKKEIKGTIECPGNNIHFEEDENSEFIIGLGKSRIYNRKNALFIESVDPSNNLYWKVAMSEKK